MELLCPTHTTIKVVETMEVGASFGTSSMSTIFSILYGIIQKNYTEELIDKTRVKLKLVTLSRHSSREIINSPDYY